MAQQIIKSIRGVHDILPDQSPVWQYFESTYRQLMAQYGYSEIRTPILESTHLFSRSIGEVTDIVEKEMYTFTDLNESSLTLRPEGTASTVRSGVQHGLFYNQQQRLWYTGPMFRREKPQKGRYRQFHQVGAETFGMPGPEIDAELIVMTARFWSLLKLDNIHLELNSIGSAESRQRYKEVLVEYFSQHKDLLDEDSKRRLHSNPMRILDSKNPAMRDVIKNAPVILDYLDEDSDQHFKGLCRLLDQQGIEYTINPRLVRGLDYYNKTVFEWVTTELGSQGTVCGGGRYDGLVEQLGGRETPACGFAMGIERLLALIEAKNTLELPSLTDIYMVLVGDDAIAQGIAVAEQLRSESPQLRIITNAGGGSFKAQIKRADKSGASIALIIAGDEVANNTVSVKPLRGQGQQETVASTDLKDRIATYLSE